MAEVLHPTVPREQCSGLGYPESGGRADDAQRMLTKTFSMKGKKAI